MLAHNGVPRRVRNTSTDTPSQRELSHSFQTLRLMAGTFLPHAETPIAKEGNGPAQTVETQ
jgi:hypothetical protein